MSAVATLPVDSVLLVEDSTVQRQHTAGLCRGLGIRHIHEAADGRKALNLLPSLVPPPDALIIDLEMPNMDGVELIQQLHQRQCDLPLVVLSSRGRVIIDTVIAMAEGMGMRVLAGMSKPVNAAALGHALSLKGSVVRHSMGAPSGRTAAYATRELADAIAAGQIHVHYQPKLDVRTGLPKGVEALARWRHPTLGAIPPDDFIPHAEAEDLIGALSLSVIDQALAQTAYWNSRGLRLTVAVNLSPKVLDRPMLVEEISTLVERHGLRSEQLILEVTETSVVSFLGVALGVLARLRLKGFGLSLDDYGTGFSSMQQLARIPFTELKIDRSLVNGAHERPYLQVILQSALDMTRGLRMTSVAEGIETEADWHLLQSLGCTLGQGYFIAKPMPGDAIPTWLKGHQAKLPILRETGR